MKTIINNPILNVLILIGFSASVFAQEKPVNQHNISLQQAVAMAKENNKTVQVFGIEQKAAQTDYSDAKNTMLPPWPHHLIRLIHGAEFLGFYPH